MIKKFISLFVKNSGDVKNQKVRENYGKLCGITGIVLNLFMSLLKIVSGIIAGAISVLSDGINNLSDAASSIITLLGFKLSAKKPDSKHPYGHGRMEYFSGLAVSAIIIFIAVELFKSSIEKIINNETPSYESQGVFILTLAVLGVSILIKLWMATLNRYAGKKINSVALSATAMDSISDCVSTFVVLICAVLSNFIKDVPIDGIAGIVVSIFIAFTGVRSILDILDLFLGNVPDPDLVKEIGDYVLSFDKRIVGVHDLMLHDYGPGRKVIIIHVEVPAEGNILELHDLIDNIEKGLGEKFNAIATIHMDPVLTQNERVKELKALCLKAVKDLDENFNIHDFRMNEGETHANLIFDVVITHETHISESEIISKINEKVKAFDNKLVCVINVEYSFV